jgi:hypothetical protein
MFIPFNGVLLFALAALYNPVAGFGNGKCAAQENLTTMPSNRIRRMLTPPTSTAGVGTPS